MILHSIPQRPFDKSVRPAVVTLGEHNVSWALHWILSKKKSSPCTIFPLLLTATYTSLLILLRAETSVGIRDFDGELNGALHNLFPLPAGHLMGDLSRECPVLHHEHFQLLPQQK